MRLLDLSKLSLIGITLALSACNLDPLLTRCADCGEVRSVTLRTFSPVIYDVRVRMDRGGARDLVLRDARELAVGERVEVLGQQVRPLPKDASLSWL